MLLFLTPHFARQPQVAVTAASRASRCLQVTGCTAPGVFTEDGWSLDAPAAAALVLCGDTVLGGHLSCHPSPPTLDSAPHPLLALATPESLGEAWPGRAQPRFGLLSTDNDSERPGRVWTGGKVAHNARCEVGFGDAGIAVGVSRGLRPVSPPLEVTDTDGHELFELAGQPALATLLSGLPPELRGNPPLSHLFAGLPEAGIDPEQAIASGRYGLVPILGVSNDEQSLTLAAPLSPGDMLFWALRQPAAAEEDTAALIDTLSAAQPAPEFALMFACIGRGPYFFGGEDLDLARIGARFPGLPVLGAYGAGEIAPLPGGSAIVSYSAVIALVGSHVQS
ncbi:MAG: FIST C-terminal domain-containing protein [Rhodocyclaceae bacterium]|nr:FIST C-terminal domain-containing protein [Rhodocyclaceae bacterium]